MTSPGGASLLPLREVVAKRRASGEAPALAYDFHAMLDDDVKLAAEILAAHNLIDKSSQWLPGRVQLRCGHRRAELVGGSFAEMPEVCVLCKCTQCLERAAAEEDMGPVPGREWGRLLTLEGFYEHGMDESLSEEVKEEDARRLCFYYVFVKSEEAANRNQLVPLGDWVRQQFEEHCWQPCQERLKGKHVFVYWYGCSRDRAPGEVGNWYGARVIGYDRATGIITVRYDEADPTRDVVTGDVLRHEYQVRDVACGLNFLHWGEAPPRHPTAGWRPTFYPSPHEGTEDKGTVRGTSRVGQGRQRQGSPAMETLGSAGVRGQQALGAEDSGVAGTSARAGTGGPGGRREEPLGKRRWSAAMVTVGGQPSSPAAAAAIAAAVPVPAPASVPARSAAVAPAPAPRTSAGAAPRERRTAPSRTAGLDPNGVPLAAAAAAAAAPPGPSRLSAAVAAAVPAPAAVPARSAMVAPARSLGAAASRERWTAPFRSPGLDPTSVPAAAAAAPAAAAAAAPSGPGRVGRGAGTRGTGPRVLPAAAWSLGTSLPRAAAATGVSGGSRRVPARRNARKPRNPTRATFDLDFSAASGPTSSKAPVRPRVSRVQPATERFVASAAVAAAAAAASDASQPLPSDATAIDALRCAAMAAGAAATATVGDDAATTSGSYAGLPGFSAGPSAGAESAAGTVAGPSPPLRHLGLPRFISRDPRLAARNLPGTSIAFTDPRQFAGQWGSSLGWFGAEAAAAGAAAESQRGRPLGPDEVQADAAAAAQTEARKRQRLGPQAGVAGGGTSGVYGVPIPAGREGLQECELPPAAIAAAAAAAAAAVGVTISEREQLNKAGRGQGGPPAGEGVAGLEAAAAEECKMGGVQEEVNEEAMQQEGGEVQERADAGAPAAGSDMDVVDAGAEAAAGLGTPLAAAAPQGASSSVTAPAGHGAPEVPIPLEMDEAALQSFSALGEHAPGGLLAQLQHVVGDDKAQILRLLETLVAGLELAAMDASAAVHGVLAQARQLQAQLRQELAQQGQGEQQQQQLGSSQSGLALLERLRQGLAGAGVGAEAAAAGAAVAAAGAAVAAAGAAAAGAGAEASHSEEGRQLTPQSAEEAYAQERERNVQVLIAQQAVRLQAPLAARPQGAQPTSGPAQSSWSVLFEALGVDPLPSGHAPLPPLSCLLSCITGVMEAMGASPACVRQALRKLRASPMRTSFVYESLVRHARARNVAWVVRVLNELCHGEWAREVAQRHATALALLGGGSMEAVDGGMARQQGEAQPVLLGGGARA